MPLLPLEPMTFPDDLFANGASFVKEASGWWVLHTKPRTEKSLARKCLKGKALTGQVIRRGRSSRFVVQVQFIQQGVSAELEGWTIQPIDAPPEVASSGR